MPVGCLSMFLLPHSSQAARQFHTNIGRFGRTSMAQVVASFASSLYARLSLETSNVRDCEADQHSSVFRKTANDKLRQLHSNFGHDNVAQWGSAHPREARLGARKAPCG
jgi:hypothetical protein